ncbi:MAG TPA: oxidoreductase, partial [Cupriavidus sp.]|nr:oxidoreductase [Cupriavidus sp.]
MPGAYSTGVAGIGIRLRHSGGQAMTNAAVNTRIENDW